MRKQALTFLLTSLMATLLGARGVDQAQEGIIRRVHAPFFEGDIRWAEAGILWFGRVDPPGAPGQNYADVRVAYNDQELAIFINVEDYYIWYDKTATPGSDLSQYDAVAVYLDTAHDRAGAPQVDDYLFLSGLRLHEGEANYRREARGTGMAWDPAWAETWDDGTWASWFVNPGANDEQWDYGWWSYIHIPWETLGLAGPPPQGTVWGLGTLLYDRDGPSVAGYLSPEHWPESFDASQPLTWGELVFGVATFEPQSALPHGTAVIRRGLVGGTIEDAWVGGGGNCSGGQDGDPEHDNHGESSALFVANQSLIADFPCFSKSFLRFPLSSIPPGKTIISATVTLQHWGNARGDLAQPSLIWLFTVDGDWGESTLTWNNAPLAQKNLTATWVDALTAFPGWDNAPFYSWDATQAVAEAYAVGEQLDVALYTADTNFHSSKYLVSSDIGDWNAEGRPTLTVVWGEPLAELRKEVRPTKPTQGQVVTYTLALLGNGEALTLTDDLPAQVSAPLAIQVVGGPAAQYESGAHRLVWSGSPGAGQPVTITFPVTVLVSGPQAVFNAAVLSDSAGLLSSDATVLIVDARHIWLPLILRGG